MIGHSLYTIIGVVILAFLAFDLSATVLQASEGPASRLIQSLTQRLLSALYRLTNRRIFLVWSTTVLIASLVILWIALLYVGWLLIFSADLSAVVRSSDRIPASFEERIYFTGFAISTLGVGDYVPGTAMWRFLTVVASLTGFFLLTLVISFLLTIAQKQSLHRRLALFIHHVGTTPQELIIAHWNPAENRVLNSVLETIVSDLVQFEQQQLDQPILNRFHGPSKERSIQLAIVTLDEALTIADVATETTLPSHFPHARKAISSYLSALDYIELEHEPDAPPIPDLTALREAGIPLCDEQAIRHAYAGLNERRSKLHALVKSTGWEWDTVTGIID